MESVDSHDKAQMASESIKPLEQGNKIIRGASGLLNAIPFVKCTPEVFSICSDEVGACTTLLEDAQERRPAAPLDDNIPLFFHMQHDHVRITVSPALDTFLKNDEAAGSGDR